jgi:hypothetical protein
VASERQLEALEIALEHAREWQKLHAEQRLRAMDFFLITTAFLTTAYATTLPTSPRLAIPVAGAGVIISFAFNRMELRAKGLVKRGEEALEPLEDQLAELTGNPMARLVARARHSMFLTSYAKVFGLLHWVAFLGFSAALLVAVNSAVLAH